MQLKKFQIMNYKSIKAFDPCWLAGDLTILAGKNESGKTAVLEALRDFDHGVDELSEAAIPLDGASPEPELHLWFSLSPSELLLLEDFAGKLEDKAKEYIEKHGLPIVKIQSGHYNVGPELLKILDEPLALERSRIIGEILSASKKSRNHFKTLPQKVEEDNLDEFFATLDKAYAPVAQIIEETIKQRDANGGDLAPDAKIILENNYQIKELYDGMKNLHAEFQQNILDDEALIEGILEEIALPRFIFFDSFSHLLPYEIPLTEVEQNAAVMDFIKVADIDIEQVRAAKTTQRRANLLSQKSATLSGNFAEYWDQDSISLAARADGDKLVIMILEADKPTQFKPEQRSKGFQWFLSFYLRLKAEEAEDSFNIILIDEPDRHLHAKAQENILSVLQDKANEAQIIISTHSPYLIDSSKLGRVKLVTKDLNEDEGTVVHNKIHKDADSETLMPIMTALGLNIAKDNHFVRERNVILEGMSDYYYLHAMAEYLDVDVKTLSFIPAVGATQTHLLASVFLGWGLSFIVLLDNDSEGSRAEKTLKELRLDENQVLKVTETDDSAMEDLFSRDDFKKYVLEASEDVADKPNSKLTKAKEDKVLKAKLFQEKISTNKPKVVLSKETKDNFAALFKKIAASFGANSKAANAA